MRHKLHKTHAIDVGLAGLTADHLAVARSEAQKQGISLRESVLRLGVVSERQLLAALSEKAGLEFSDSPLDCVQPDALAAVTAKIASHYQIVPVRIEDDVLWVATCDPFNPDLQRELQIVLNHDSQVQFILATSESIRNAIRKSYGLGAANIEQMVADTEVEDSAKPKVSAEDSKADEASVMKLVNQIVIDAIGSGATDIHVEPFEDDLKVRYRIDGMLHNAGIPPAVRHFRDGITSRIKIMSNLDIAEKRLPQDGRADIAVGGQTFDLRISVLPTRHGEAINIRILRRGSLMPDLASLGMPQRDIDQLTSLITKPHGIILVTGPTGSGKTTTLYTCMHILNNSDRKIITIEDPVEYDMTGLVQMQVHADIGFTFARALRSMLRHDPDIMLVGEIRDLETAETAIRTALTGHLVFSTLHTNNAASAITRILDMGIEPYLAASSIEGILAQRLVRLICPDCKEPAEPRPEIATAIRTITKQQVLPQAWKGRGCAKCRFTGYHGRTAITELITMSDELRDLTIQRSHATHVDSVAQKQGTTPLLHAGIEKVHARLTTYEEVLRVTKGTV